MDEHNSEETRWRFSRYAPPKSASGEWTRGSVQMLFTHSVSDYDLDLIANAHNAALAAERDRIPPPVDNKYVAEGCEQFGNQEDTNRLTNALVFADKTIAGLHRIITGHANQIEKLERQLAAERDKVQTLTDALKEVELYRHSWDTTHPCSLVADIAKDALAKVKE